MYAQKPLIEKYIEKPQIDLIKDISSGKNKFEMSPGLIGPGVHMPASTETTLEGKNVDLKVFRSLSESDYKFTIKNLDKSSKEVTAGNKTVTEFRLLFKQSLDAPTAKSVADEMRKLVQNNQKEKGSVELDFVRDQDSKIYWIGVFWLPEKTTKPIEPNRLK